jgi:hypothetical protein
MSILALTSDTLIGTAAAGNIEYNGQFFGTDSAASRAQLQRIARATAVSASGTSIDFTGIPAWVEKITVMFNGVSTSGTSGLLVQIGSGSVTTTGYVSTGSAFTTGAPVYQTSTSGFALYNDNATDVRTGHLNITNITGNQYVTSAVLLGNVGRNITFLASGSITLGGTLDRVRITTVNGTDTFDAGTINILYEG